jgi:putative phosphoribosyl transferase
VSVPYLHRAGRELEALLAPTIARPMVVFGIPRHGVAVAMELARALHAPLDTIIAGKVFASGGVPPALGSISVDGIRLEDPVALERAGVPRAEVSARFDHALARLRARLPVLRSGAALPALRGRTAVIVDDVVVSGLTMEVAILSLRGRRPGRIVAAAAVCAHPAAERLGSLVEELVILERVEQDEAERRHAEIEHAICPPLKDREIRAWLSASRHGVEPGHEPEPRLDIDDLDLDLGAVGAAGDEPR